MLAGFTHEPAVALAEALVRVAPPGLSRVFYADNGSSAVEVALKLSFHYWRNLGRGARTESVLVWAETGRTDGLKGTLAGLSGSPVLDRAGRVIGVTVAESPRRGRIYTAAPETLAAALAATHQRAARFAVGEPITVDNYGRVADTLRRDLRVAQVICLKAS